MEKQLFTDIAIMGGERSFYGTDVDKELVDAFFALDRKGVVEALKKGANIDLDYTVKRDGKEVTSKLLYHLLTEHPEKANIKKLEVHSSREEEQKRAEAENRRENNREREKTRLRNIERSEKIIDFAKFWLDLGGYAAQDKWAGRVAIYPQDIKFGSVREFVERTSDIDYCVSHAMIQNGFKDDDESYEIFLSKAAQYRDKSGSIDEIKNQINSDKDLNKSQEADN